MSAGIRVLHGVLGLAIAALPNEVPAAEWQIDLDPSKTEITFTLKATMHTVHGDAAAPPGRFRLDDTNGSMTGTVAIDAMSAATGNAKRDLKMHARVLRSGEFSKITLTADHLEGELDHDGSSGVTLHGRIEIMGQPHEISIPLQADIEGEKFAAVGEFEIPYVDWGLEDPSTFVLWVAKVVGVKFSAHGTIRPAGH